MNHHGIRTAAALGALLVAAIAQGAFAGTTSYKYDALGRVTEVDYPDGSIVTYTTIQPVTALRRPARQARQAL
jgi:YD repeat-containing protein